MEFNPNFTCKICLSITIYFVASNVGMFNGVTVHAHGFLKFTTAFRH
jgi:hypothetical protein